MSYSKGNAARVHEHSVTCIFVNTKHKPFFRRAGGLGQGLSHNAAHRYVRAVAPGEESLFEDFNY
jgi:hypothetical protein